MKDKCGVPLEGGDYIVYGHALGRCAGLRYGLVLEANDDSIKIIGYNDDWPGSKYGDHLLSKPSRLVFPGRILRIYSSQVPEHIQLALGEYAANYGK